MSASKRSSELLSPKCSCLSLCLTDPIFPVRLQGASCKGSAGGHRERGHSYGLSRAHAACRSHDQRVMRLYPVADDRSLNPRGLIEISVSPVLASVLAQVLRSTDLALANAIVYGLVIVCFDDIIRDRVPSNSQASLGTVFVPGLFM